MVVLQQFHADLYIDTILVTIKCNKYYGQD